MQKLAEENQLLKVKNAGKEGEIAVKHEQLAVQLIVEEMRANALAQNAAIENNFRHFNALLQSLTSHNQMAVDSQDSQAQLDAQERQAAQAAAQQQTTVQ
jgi:hypothetical protein